jgi:uncharacterized protein (DUF58 family)
MRLDEKPRSRRRGSFRAAVKRLLARWPTERSMLTREGLVYAVVSMLLLIAGLWQQVNLILLVFTLTAGPFVASIYGGRSMLRRLSVSRRVPAYVFSGDLLAIDYAMENSRRWHDALAVFLEDALIPVDRSIPGATNLTPWAFFARVAPGQAGRVRWQGVAPSRGSYVFRDLDLGTRSPFGIVEHRATLALSDQIVVYPQIGQLTRRWLQMQRQVTESRRGQRHDRSAQQLEYHGLRDYRSGDSPRWIHWRTSARRNGLMVKEFEEQNEQDLAILVDPWLPRTRAGPEQHAALETAISFAATLALETCRHQGRRLVLGWTGPAADVRQGPSSVKLLHEVLEQLAVMRSTSEGGLAALFDILPPAVLREAILIIVSTRPINLVEEAERSARLSGTAARSLLARTSLLNAAAGDLVPLFQPAQAATNNLLHQRVTSALADRLSSREQRSRGRSQEGRSAESSRTPPSHGEPAA